MLAARRLVLRSPHSLPTLSPSFRWCGEGHLVGHRYQLHAQPPPSLPRPRPPVSPFPRLLSFPPPPPPSPPLFPCHGSTLACGGGVPPHPDGHQPGAHHPLAVGVAATPPPPVGAAVSVVAAVAARPAGDPQMVFPARPLPSLPPRVGPDRRLLGDGDARRRDAPANGMVPCASFFGFVPSTSPPPCLRVRARGEGGVWGAPRLDVPLVSFCLPCVCVRCVGAHTLAGDGKSGSCAAAASGTDALSPPTPSSPRPLCRRSG